MLRAHTLHLFLYLTSIYFLLQAILCFELTIFSRVHLMVQYAVYMYYVDMEGGVCIHFSAAFEILL